MGRHFDNELRDLKFSLMAMAGQVEEMIDQTRKALKDRSDATADQVLAADEQVDELELRLDQACIDLLGLRAPFASDLRLLASTLKIVPELERIGDHCCNICRRSKYLTPQPNILGGDWMERLGDGAHSMVRRAMDAFVSGDAALARAVIADDDKVDEIYLSIYRELLRLMISDPLCIERASNLLIIIKNWERIADQACSIAQEVLFILEGVSAKHPRLQTPNP